MECALLIMKPVVEVTLHLILSGTWDLVWVVETPENNDHIVKVAIPLSIKLPGKSSSATFNVKRSSFRNMS